MKKIFTSVFILFSLCTIAQVNIGEAAPEISLPDAKGTVTAGNSSPTRDGASFVLVVSEKMLKTLNVKPMERFVSYAVCAIETRIMGVGHVYAIPSVLKL